MSDAATPDYGNDVFGGNRLVVSRYLLDKVNDPERAKKAAPQFGKAVKKLYTQFYGRPPKTVEVELDDRTVTVCQYTLADTPFFDEVWFSSTSGAWSIVKKNMSYSLSYASTPRP